MPPDSFLISNAKLIGFELMAAKVKSVASVETYIEKGALMGVVPDYLELGKAAAAIVHRHQQGTNFREMPVQAAKQPQLLIIKNNQQNAQHQSTRGYSQAGGYR